MTEDFEDFFADNTQWVGGGEDASAAPAPPRPPASRREMRRRRRDRRIKQVVAVVSIVAIVVLIVVGSFYGYRVVRAWRAANATDSAIVEDYDGPGDTDVQFTVESGQGATDIAANLVKADIVKSEAAFTSVVSGNNATLYPGTYALKTHMKAADVVTILSDQSKATGFLEVKPGDRASAVIASAATLSGIDESEFESVLNGGGSGILPAEAGGSFEGWLEPGTYDVQNRTAEEIIKQMVDKRIEKLDQLGVPSGDERERILKIASIAEAEVNRDEYYGKVARVIENRLADGMYLGMDTSLAYGLNKSASEITQDDIDDVNHTNPYNLHDGHTKGLPPTPISNPGDSAIKAAMNPDEGDWLYFVTVNLSTGETKFVSTEDEFWQIREEYKENNADAN